MPITPLDQVLSNLEPSDVLNQDLPSMETEKPLDIGAGDLLKQAWQRNTFTGSLATFGINDHSIQDPNYNAADKLRDTPYWLWSDEAIYANNDAELGQWKQQKDKEIQLANTMSRAGTAGFIANIGAQFGDILTYIPIAGWAGKGFKAASILKGAAYGAATAAGAIGLQEFGIQQTQIGRTTEESLLNTATGAIFGSILGGGISLFTKGADSLAPSIVKEVLSNNDAPAMSFSGGSVGAAYHNPFSNDAHLAGMQVTLNGKKFEVANMLQVPGLKAPVLEGLTADSLVLNNITSAMFEHSNLERKNVVTPEMNANSNYGLETAPAVDTLMKLDRRQVYDFQKDMKSTYLEYAQVKPGPMEAMRAKLSSMTSTKKSFNDVLKEAAESARRGDISDNPHVKRMAEIIRNNIEQANKQMERAGVPLPEKDLKGRISYYPIVYDHNKILADRPGFEKILQDHFYRTIKSEDGANTPKLRQSAARTLAQQTTDNILGAGEQNALLSDISRMSLDKGVNFTKERTLNIPDTMVENYLVNDPLKTISQYMTQASQLSRFYEMLGNFGATKFDDVKLKLHEEFEKNALNLNPKDKNHALNKKKLTETYTKNQNLLQDFGEIMLGQYAKRTKFDSALRALRTYNYLRLMGYITLSSITDMAMPVFKHGLGATLKGYAGGLRNIATNTSKLEKNMLNHIGVALEQEIDGALRTIIDPEFGSNMLIRKEKVGTGLGPSVQKLYDDFIYGANVGLDRASAVFNKASLITYWNTFHKRLGARIAISRIMDDVNKYEKLSAKEKTYLNSIGIGSEDIASIKSQFKQYGGEENGVYISDIRSWSNAKTAEKFSAAVLKEVDSTVVTPGRGDIPRFVQHGELPRTLLQFKGFFSAMTSKVLVSGLQRHDANVAQGVVAMLSLGALQYVIRQQLQGKEPNTDVNNLIVEGINRSGMLGLLGDPLFGIILNNKLGGGSRYYNQNWIEYMLGPSASLIKTSNRVFNDIKQGQADDKTMKAAETLMPFQNLFYLRILFDKMNGK